MGRENGAWSAWRRVGGADWVRRSEWACGALCEALGAVQEQSWSRRVPWKARNRPVERRKAAAGVWGARKSRKRLYGAFRGAGGRSGAELESESVGRRGIGL